MSVYKNIVITGGTKGIGRFLAEEFLKQGSSVVVCSRSDSDVTHALEELSSFKGKVFGIKVDVTVVDDVRKLVAFSLQSLGSVDVLINTAGVIGEVGDFGGCDISKWKEAVLVNLFGTVQVTHAFLPYMKERSFGVVINFAGAGVGSKKPLVNMSSYYTSKTAVVGFTEVVAKELEDSSIRINCVAPGAINTAITDYIINQGREKVGADMYDRTVKQKEEGGDSKEKIFSLVSFLAGDESKGVSGRFISSKWDSLQMLKGVTENSNLFALRRIDNELFYEK